jgi:hypothetical protein
MTTSNDSNGKTFWATLPGMITALAALLTAVAGLLALWYQPGGSPGSTGTDGPKPTSSTERAIKDVLDQQARYINQGDYEDAYALFADRTQQAVSLRQYKAWFKARPGYSVVDHEFKAIKVQGDKASVWMDFTYDIPGRDSGRVERVQLIVREDGQWRVVMRDDQIEAFQSG